MEVEPRPRVRFRLGALAGDVLFTDGFINLIPSHEGSPLFQAKQDAT